MLSSIVHSSAGAVSVRLDQRSAGIGHPLAMDLQSRKTEYGAGRHHAHAEIEARCLTPLLADVKNGGITPSPVLKIKYLRID